MEGWIKLHRKFLDWEWYSDSGMVHLFMHLLFKANHETKRWQGIVINRGQFVTSYDKLSAELPLSVQQIRTRLSKLKSTGEITIKNNNKYSIITVTCYSDYQAINKPDNKPVTSEQQTDNKQITTTKELKELKELKEDKESDLFDIFYDAYQYKIGKQDAVKAFKSAIKKVGLQDILDKVAEYDGYLQVTGYHKKNPATWLNGKSWENDYFTLTQQHKGNGYATKSNNGKNYGASKSEQARAAVARGLAAFGVE